MLNQFCDLTKESPHIYTITNPNQSPHNGRSNFIVWLLVEQPGRKIIALANVIGPFGGSIVVCPLASRNLSRTYGSMRVSGLSARRAGNWRVIDALMLSSVGRSSYV